MTKFCVCGPQGDTSSFSSAIKQTSTEKFEECCSKGRRETLVGSKFHSDLLGVTLVCCIQDISKMCTFYKYVFQHRYVYQNNSPTPPCKIIKLTCLQFTLDARLNFSVFSLLQNLETTLLTEKWRPAHFSFQKGCFSKMLNRPCNSEKEKQNHLNKIFGISRST